MVSVGIVATYIVADEVIGRWYYDAPAATIFNSFGSLIVIAALVGLAILIQIVVAVKPERWRRRKVVRRLADHATISSFNRLVQAREFEDSATRKIADAALWALLPKLAADHQELLDDRSLRYLRSYLQAPVESIWNQEVFSSREKRKLNLAFQTSACIAAIRALSLFGDPESVHHIEELANRESSSDASAQVANEARKWYPVALKRFREQTNRSTLLRGASLGEDTLLTPAAPQRDDSQTLLRGKSPDDKMDVNDQEVTHVHSC